MRVTVDIRSYQRHARSSSCTRPLVNISALLYLLISRKEFSWKYEIKWMRLPSHRCCYVHLCRRHAEVDHSITSVGGGTYHMVITIKVLRKEWVDH